MSIFNELAHPRVTGGSNGGQFTHKQLGEPDIDLQPLPNECSEVSNEWENHIYHPNPRVRMDAAMNPNLPPTAAASLCNDHNSEVRKSLAKNPQAPGPVLERLSKDKEWSVRFEVARHPNTPTTVLESLAKDPDGDVQWDAEQALKDRVAM